MTLALFDLDNTLIGADSDYLWGEYLVARKLVDVQAYQKTNQAFYQDYVDGALDAAAYLRFALAPLAEFEPSKLQELHTEFMREYIDPIWLTEAEALVEKHKSAGHQVIVVTATNRFIVEPIVRRFGIEELICPEPEMQNGRYTGNFVGPTCFAEGKVEKMALWLQNNNASLEEDSWFYSDSHNDLPLLEKVTNPVAVDPDAKLRSIAKERNWPIISLR